MPTTIDVTVDRDYEEMKTIITFDVPGDAIVVTKPGILNDEEVQRIALIFKKTCEEMFPPR